MQLFIGLMSGTSMDGIDAALGDMSTNRFHEGITRPYSAEVKKLLSEAVSGKPNSLAFFSQLNTLLGREFAAAVFDLLKKAKQPAESITAIGSHGQTLCHNPEATIPYTLQLGCAHTIAEQTGIKVVADFRTRDLIAGGQGAPFAPIYHQVLFQHQSFPLAIVNVGGIANISYLATADEVTGYDTGPGNCLMDAWIDKHLLQPFDNQGAWAASGRVIAPLLSQLLDEPYFKNPPPKSLGKEYFSLHYLDQFLEDDYAAVDVQATLLQLTAQSIADAILKLPKTPRQVFICGGGAHNQALLKALSILLSGIPIGSTESIGINPDYIEALMFAWLAQKTLEATPMHLNKITGAKYPIILGAIYPAGIDKRISLDV